ncbi:MBL fold metallo-hydrolase [Chitinophaga qingshengii]|uniref:MBL fold metallo-hydrolase n=1 Tax=Chitinophaga qingshengii TaxID=1569794 RepID=A0ABR7TFJ5_9BACT|nr:MBL fold metallo-hydrolase [Chitinophaga qingshengii]MBC9929074.1 MBL fold metallo-hydrolase [Chitinophaga qingshengii]
MEIRQFEDKGLAHYSYAVYSEQANEIILVDPSRDVTPYLAFAAEKRATITGVIETHPHADFVSSHLELHDTTGATIYCSALVGAAYPHTTFDDGQTITTGELTFKALNTPGHSPDSISIVLEEKGVVKAVFTGDTLFIGDCGRPDLREKAGNLTATRSDLARQMYHSLREKLMTLPDQTLVYPAHGAGTLCGKSLSAANSSTIGAEKLTNWSLQDYTEDAFVAELLSQQPYIPKYFPYDVDINRKGATAMVPALEKVPAVTKAEEGITIVDTRPAALFKQGHLPKAINLQLKGKFETWLGSVIAPGEAFYLVAADDAQLEEALLKSASIGYESMVRGAMVYAGGTATMDPLPLDTFKAHPEQFTIVDVRMDNETQTGLLIPGAITIPLDQLRERLNEIPTAKPVVVHCAGGYRSAAGSSIVAAVLDTPVYDLGEDIKAF